MSLPTRPSPGREANDGVRRAALLLCAGALLSTSPMAAAAKPAQGDRLWVDAPLERVEVLGLTHTRPDVVLRELSVPPGEPMLSVR